MFKKAFSLLELILVVVIVGVVYAMALSSLHLPEKKDIETFSLFTLPQYLRDNFSLQDAKLVCFEPCDKCSVLVDGEWQEEEFELFESSDVRSYQIDKEGFTLESEFAPHDIDDPYKQACFILHKRVNDSINPIVLEAQGKFIYYKAAYEEVKAYKSLSEIQTQYQKSMTMIRNER